LRGKKTVPAPRLNQVVNVFNNMKANAEKDETYLIKLSSNPLSQTLICGRAGNPCRSAIHRQQPVALSTPPFAIITR